MSDVSNGPTGDQESVRDRLRAPAGHGEQSGPGDSRQSDLSSSDFQQTHSGAALESAVGDGHAQLVEHGTTVLHPGKRIPLDEAAAKAAERKVALLFLSAVVGVVGFVVCFIAVPFDFGTNLSTAYTPLLGIFMTMALVGVGAGAVLWAKTLMVDEEMVQERHPFASEPETRTEAAAILASGFQETGLPRRSLLRNSLLLGAGSLAILPVPLLFGFGRFQHKEDKLRATSWKKGVRLIRSDGSAVKLGDVAVGGVETVFPDVPDGNKAADSASLIIRMRPDELQVSDARKNWSVDGHIVYSIVCTHLGCPVKLYEQQTHHLFCPCHQSTFDAAREAKVLFGPAARNLPQLAISVDSEGYFIAQGDYSEPVGPSFWERKS